MLDTSGSMTGVPISELKKGLAQFLKETAEDEAASQSVEICVITYGETAGIAMPFCNIAEVDQEPPELIANGMTPLGWALKLGLEEIKARRMFYKKLGISSYKPWLVLMTDGKPNDDWQISAKEARSMAESNQLTFLGIGIGPEVDMTILKQILPEKQPPMQLRGLQFKPFFKWLTDSLRSVTSGTISNEDKLKYAPVSSFADLINK
jgi:uncharacterized protein YegL